MDSFFSSFDQLYFNPLIPMPLLVLLAVAGLLMIIIGLRNKAHAQGVRLIILSAFIWFLAGPSLITRETEPLANRVLVLMDQTTSMGIADRQTSAQKTLDHIRQQAGPDSEIVVRTINDAPQNQGSQIIRALQKYLAEENKAQLSAVFVVSDGQSHDNASLKLPELGNIPIHSMLVGDKDFIDRRLVIEKAPEYALVGRRVEMLVRVEDRDQQSRPVRLTVKRDGELVYQSTVRSNRSLPVMIEANKRGAMLIETEVSALEGETILQNNIQRFSINAVRDRLRVLLVSGEPHQGGRIWRQTLNSDPAVDLIHFTILRLPTSRDSTPVQELALIPFPTEELFEKQLDKFDLVIFDRYRLRGVLAMQYLRNLAQYVENGGAMLVATGPEFSERYSLYATALSSILPAAPTGRVDEQGFQPKVTDLGKRHPVTAGLNLNGSQNWGRWFRINETVALDGNTLMTDGRGHPLLVLSREGKGRIAQFMSDQIWMWARGVEQGGPYHELVRRTAHWLMKEPDLEEEALRVKADDHTISIETRSLLSQDGLAEVKGPEGFQQTIQLEAQGGGLSRGQLDVTKAGIYTVTERDKSQLVAIGVLNDKEYDKPYPVEEKLAPISRENKGGVFWVDDQMPTIRTISDSAAGAGTDWAGIRNRNAVKTLKIIETPLVPPFWVALLLLSLAIVTWWRESR